MPVYLGTLNIYAELSRFKSVLIVPCRICPAISLAIHNRKPYIEFFRRFLRTGVFYEHIRSIRIHLEEEGIRTGVFESNFPIPMVCMWSAGQRKRLLKSSGQYEAVAVLGCDSAAYTVKESLKSTGCKIIQAMRVAGIVSATPRFHFPLNISLEILSKENISWPTETREALHK